jgi:hypothetical protein
MGGLGLRNLLHLQAEISWLSLGPDQSWGAKVSINVQLHQVQGSHPNQKVWKIVTAISWRLRPVIFKKAVLVVISWVLKKCVPNVMGQKPVGLSRNGALSSYSFTNNETQKLQVESWKSWWNLIKPKPDKTWWNMVKHDETLVLGHPTLDKPLLPILNSCTCSSGFATIIWQSKKTWDHFWAESDSQALPPIGPSWTWKMHGHPDFG